MPDHSGINGQFPRFPINDQQNTDKDAVENEPPSGKFRSSNKQVRISPPSRQLQRAPIEASASETDPADLSSRSATATADKTLPTPILKRSPQHESIMEDLRDGYDWIEAFDSFYDESDAADYINKLDEFSNELKKADLEAIAIEFNANAECKADYPDVLEKLQKMIESKTTVRLTPPAPVVNSVNKTAPTSLPPIAGGVALPTSSLAVKMAASETSKPAGLSGPSKPSTAAIPVNIPAPPESPPTVNAAAATTSKPAEQAGSPKPSTVTKAEKMAASVDNPASPRTPAAVSTAALATSRPAKSADKSPLRRVSSVDEIPDPKRNAIGDTGEVVAQKTPPIISSNKPNSKGKYPPPVAKKPGKSTKTETIVTNESKSSVKPPELSSQEQAVRTNLELSRATSPRLTTSNTTAGILKRHGIKLSKDEVILTKDDFNESKFREDVVNLVESKTFRIQIKELMSYTEKMKRHSNKEVQKLGTYLDGYFKGNIDVHGRSIKSK